MANDSNASRRRFLGQLMLGATLGSLALGRATATRAADAALLSPTDPAAKKLKYTEDATHVKEAAGNKCSSCALYQGAGTSKQGPCQIFPGKDVKAAGWCTSWAPQM
jgi:High potential iron-sulfur protein